VIIIVFLLIQALNIYMWLIIASVLISWLVAFDVLNTRNPWVYKGVRLLNRVVEPGMSRLRKIIPSIGNIDFTPMVMMFLIMGAQSLLVSLVR
jgi:YggT family protein